MTTDTKEEARFGFYQPAMATGRHLYRRSPAMLLLLGFLLFYCSIRPAEGTFCAGMTYFSSDTTGGNFTSPDYPSNYTINVYCSWLIEASSSSNVVRLQVTINNMESAGTDGTCTYDYGRAYDGSDMTTLLGEWCGDTTVTLTSTGTTMLVVFHSDDDTVGSGFVASYYAGVFPAEVVASTDYTALIAGCTVAGLLLITGIILLCCLCKRHRKRKKTSALVSNKDPEKQPTGDEDSDTRFRTQSAKSRFTERIIPSSEGKRPQAVEVSSSSPSIGWRSGRVSPSTFGVVKGT